MTRLNDVGHRALASDVAGRLDAEKARPKPKPVKRKKHKHVFHNFLCKCGYVKNKRARLEWEVEQAIRKLIAWRDGPQCVEHGIDGGRCNNVLQWGHLIPRRQSPWLKYDLATFVQCGTHNMLHDKGDPTMLDWFMMEFGAEAYHALCEEVRLHKGEEPSFDDLRRMLAHYTALMENPPRIHTKAALIEMGYYGSVVMEGWERERARQLDMPAEVILTAIAESEAA